MEQQWKELGVGAVLALLVIRQVLDFLKVKINSNGITNGNGSFTPKEAREMAQQIRELYEWHNATDEDGVKVWYVRKSLERHIAELSSAIRDLIKTVQDDRKER